MHPRLSVPSFRLRQRSRQYPSSECGVHLNIGAAIPGIPLAPGSVKRVQNLTGSVREDLPGSWVRRYNLARLSGVCGMKTQLNLGLKRRLMYVENKDGEIDGANGRIGWVTFSKS